MNKRNRIIVAAILALGLVAAAAPVSRAQDNKEERRWDTLFAGHEMWGHDIDAALTTATKEGRPMLVDFYKFH